MKNKKVIVLSIALILVAGTAFANPVRGVRWHSETIAAVEGTRFVNSNNHEVFVEIICRPNGFRYGFHLTPRHMNMTAADAHWFNMPIRDIRSVTVRMTREAPYTSISLVPRELIGIWHRSGVVSATVTISDNQIQVVYSDGGMFVGNITNVSTENNSGRNRSVYPSGWSISYNVTTVIGSNFPFEVGQNAISYFFINSAENRLVQPDDDRAFEKL